MTTYQGMPDSKIHTELRAMIPLLADYLARTLADPSDDALDYAPAAASLISMMTQTLLCEDMTISFRAAFNNMLMNDTFQTELMTLSADLELPLFSAFIDAHIDDPI